MMYEGLKTTVRTNLSKFFCLFILSGSLLLCGCYTQLAFNFSESESFVIIQCIRNKCFFAQL